jgi:hypothetical protein
MIGFLSFLALAAAFALLGWLKTTDGKRRDSR